MSLQYFFVIHNIFNKERVKIKGQLILLLFCYQWRKLSLHYVCFVFFALCVLSMINQWKNNVFCKVFYFKQLVSSNTLEKHEWNMIGCSISITMTMKRECYFGMQRNNWNVLFYFLFCFILASGKHTHNFLIIFLFTLRTLKLEFWNVFHF